MFPAGSLPEDHREERVPGAALGTVCHPERRLPDETAVEIGRLPYPALGTPLTTPHF